MINSKQHSPVVSPFDSALSMARALREGTLSSRELVELHIERIERLDHTINAVVQRDFEGARRRADAADQVLQQWRDQQHERKGTTTSDAIKIGIFHGVPMTIKEQNLTPGFSACAGDDSMFAGFPSRASTPNTTRLLEESGVILVGKTNTPLQNADWECANPNYGRTLNPYDRRRTPGGSSGGSAAALACGFTPIELGTDLGGSIRVPASFCGVVGHCATAGLLPPLRIELNLGSCVDKLVNNALVKFYGPPMEWMARQGPMARSVDDVKAMVELLGGEQAEALPRPKPNSTLADYRIAVWRDHAPSFPVSTHISKAIDKVVDALKAQGATVEAFEPPMDPMESYATYLQFLSGGRATFMPKEQYRNVKQGRPQKSYPPDMRSPFCDMDTASVHGIPPETRDRLEEVHTKWDPCFQSFDCVLCPAFPCEAFANANDARATLYDARVRSRKLTIEGLDDPIRYGDAMFWSHLSVLLGLPATAFPVGFTADTDPPRPVGLQAVGARNTDLVVLDVVQKLMAALGTDRFRPPPGFE